MGTNLQLVPADTSTVQAPTLADSIPLTDNGVVSFSWTDDQETCRLWRELVQREPGLRADFERRLADTEKLRHLPVWLRGADGVLRTNLYELYSRHLREGAGPVPGISIPAFHEVSLLSPSGPWKRMALSDCFNLRTYQDFVIVFLIQDLIPQREFRLRVKSRILAEYGKGFGEACLVEVEQLTTRGVLLRLPAETFYAGMIPHGRARFLMGQRPLSAALAAPNPRELRRQLGEWGTNPFHTLDKRDAFQVPCRDLQVGGRFDAGRTRETYLHVTYEQIRASHGPLAERLETFVARAHGLVRELVKLPRAA